MPQNKIKYFLSLAILAICAFGVRGQETKNNFSPYTKYGLGEIKSEGTLSTRSMGGAGVALRSSSAINLLNPAAYSVQLQKSVLFNYEIEGSSSLVAQKINGETQNGSNTSVNFYNLSLQIPIIKGLGAALSVLPYSSVGYEQISSQLIPSVGEVSTINEGSGDISEVKFGVGYQLTDRVSIGVAAKYYWGTILRSFRAEIFDPISSTSPSSPQLFEEFSVSKFKGELGVQWSAIRAKDWTLDFGATYDFGGDLKPDYTRTAYDYNYSTEIVSLRDSSSLKIAIPRKLTLGAYYANRKLALALDYSLENWASVNSDEVQTSIEGVEVAYRNISSINLGVEYTPRRGDVRRYLNRINYRFGLRYGGYQHTFSGTELNQYGVTAGFGMPFNMLGISKINLGLEWDGIGSLKQVSVPGEEIGLVRQNYFKFALGFTLFGSDYWFQRPQID